MQPVPGLKSAKAVSVIALFTAAYLFLTAVTGLALPILRGYPAHFYRGLTMPAAAAFTRTKGTATVMGLVSGLVFAAIIPAPAAAYLIASNFAAGLTYDLFLGKNYAENSRRPRRMLTATMLSGVFEGIAAMSILTYVGLFQASAVAIAFIWVGAIAANVVLSAAGAQVTVIALRRYQR